MYNAKTLRERIENKTRADLKEKLQRVDETINQFYTEVITEAFDQETAKKSIALIKQLNSIQWPPELAQFKNASKSAIAELQGIFAGGGRQQSGFAKLVSMFKRSDNPYIDVIAYANAIHQFFTVIQQYSEAAGEAGQDTLGQVFKNNEKTFAKIVQKGLKPEGLIAKFGTNWMKKYMKNDPELKNLTTSLMKLPLAKLKEVSASIEEKLSNIDEISNSVAAAEEAISAGKNVPVDTKTSDSAKTIPADQTNSTKATKPGEVEPGKQNTDKADKELSKTTYDALLKALPDIDKEDIKKVGQALLKAGLLKSPE